MDMSCLNVTARVPILFLLKPYTSFIHSKKEYDDADDIGEVGFCVTLWFEHINFQMFFFLLGYKLVEWNQT